VTGSAGVQASGLAPGALDDLADILTAEAAELRRLLPVVEDAQQALLRADAPGLAACLERQEAPLRNLARLEIRRRALLDGAARMLGHDRDALTLSRLLAFAPRSPARLTRLREELAPLLDRLGALTRTNAFLVERSLGYVERLLGQVFALMGTTPAPTYAATGRAAPPAPGVGLVDREA
jgi:flagellar biosynthesis/type III secretory pathway chaperone